MKPVLSILICTIPSRKKMFDKLLFSIAEQLIDIPNSEELVEVLYESDDCSISIGEKRNQLMKSASSKYVVFVDDDDSVSKNYLQLLLKACQENKDCVEMRLQIVSKDNLNGSIFHYKLGHPLEPFESQQDVWHYPISHICPVKSSIAKKVRFKETGVGEDLEWSRQIAPLLKTMASVESSEPLYFYQRAK